MAECIILQNAPQGPLVGRQLLCMLKVIILCLRAPQLIYCEWRGREQKCTVSERGCWLIQNHKATCYAERYSSCGRCTKQKKMIISILSSLALKCIIYASVDRHRPIVACIMGLYRVNSVLYCHVNQVWRGCSCPSSLDAPVSFRSKSSI